MLKVILSLFFWFVGEQTPPSEPRPPDGGDTSEELSDDDAILVMDEDMVPHADKSDGQESNHIESQNTEERKSNKKQKICSTLEVKGNRQDKSSGEKVNGHNHQLKKMIIKEVRKPGKSKLLLFF